MNKKCFKFKLIYKIVSFACSGYSSWWGGGHWRRSKADVGPNRVDPGLDRGGLGGQGLWGQGLGGQGSGGQGSRGQGLGSQGSGWHRNCGLWWWCQIPSILPQPSNLQLQWRDLRQIAELILFHDWWIIDQLDVEVINLFISSEMGD